MPGMSPALSSVSQAGLELQNKSEQGTHAERLGSRGRAPVGGAEDEFLQNLTHYGYFGRGFLQ